MHFARSRLPCQHLQRLPGLYASCRHRAMLAVGSIRLRPQEATGSARQVPVQAGVTAPAHAERVREVIQPQSPAIPLQVGSNCGAPCLVGMLPFPQPFCSLRCYSDT